MVLQHPYPMYFYPDNIQETILIFQNGKFDYKRIPSALKESSEIDVKEYQQNKWYLTTWNITNVLPLKNRIEEGIAAFPEEIPYRLIKLFSYVGETVLDLLSLMIKSSLNSIHKALAIGRIILKRVYSIGKV
jgi:DNA modification methylase